MADYAQKGNDFDKRMRQGVPKNASQKGLAEFKAQRAANAQKKAAGQGQGEQRVRARGGITRD